MAYQHSFRRHKTREVRVGDKVVGGDNPIWVQSMTTPDTSQVEAVLREIHRLEEAGCEIVRVIIRWTRFASTRATSAVTIAIAR